MIGILILFVIYVVAVVLHEVGHGVAAYYLGDPTAKNEGRLTLNPLKHIDLFWTILLPIILFITSGGRFAMGMAKPVPVNFLRLRNPRRSMIWVALAGPLMNILLAFGLNFFYQIYGYPVFLYAIYFNLGLAVFNLIPIPPLDGSRIVTGLLPVTWIRGYLAIEPYGFWVIMALYAMGILSYLIFPALRFFCWLMRIPGF